MVTAATIKRSLSEISEPKQPEGAVLVMATDKLDFIISALVPGNMREAYNGTMADWQKFYKATEGKPPQPFLVKAVGFCANKSKALDLGAGTLRDTKFLLEQGFDVVAVDRSPLMLEAAKKLKDAHFQAIQAAFDQYPFPQDAFDLVNAQWALPFNNLVTFEAMFEKLAASLRKDGIFTGQFFGNRDEWKTSETKMTFHDRSEVEHLLKDFEIIAFNEEEKDGVTAVGDKKHWHVFHVIARKLKTSFPRPHGGVKS